MSQREYVHDVSISGFGSGPRAKCVIVIHRQPSPAACVCVQLPVVLFGFVLVRVVAQSDCSCV